MTAEKSAIKQPRRWYIVAAIVAAALSALSYWMALHPVDLYWTGLQALTGMMWLGLACAVCWSAAVIPTFGDALDTAGIALLRTASRLKNRAREIDYSRYAPAFSIVIYIVGFAHGLPLIIKGINPMDETLYVKGGIALTRGHWPTYDLFPTTSFFYGTLSALTGSHSIPFLAHTAHVITFTALWLIVAALALRTGPLFPLLALASNVFPALTYDSADALFTILILAAIRACLIPSYKLAILLTTFAAMARPDGLWISLLLIAYCLIKAGRREGLLACGIFCAILLADFSTEAIVNHTRFKAFSGLKERSYCAFIQGEGVSYSDITRDMDSYHTGNKIGPPIYGTGPQNHWSILSAIKHNPETWLRRVHHNLNKLPRQLEVDWNRCPYEGIGQYSRESAGIVCGVLLLGLVVALLSPRRLLYLVFALPFLAYAATFWRDGYVFAYGPIFAWVIADAAVGVTSRVHAATARRIPARNMSPSQQDLARQG